MPDLSDYARILKGKRCANCCEFSLENQPIQHYDHTGGYQVEGFANRQWLWVDCPACDYQCALWKVGVPGKATHEEQVAEEKRLGMPLSPSSEEVVEKLFLRAREARREKTCNDE